MSTFTVEVEVPQELNELGFTSEEIRREIPILLVLKLFREGSISSGKAAQILGMSRPKFLDLLAKEKIPLYDPTQNELAEEFRMARFLAASDKA